MDLEGSIILCGMQVVCKGNEATGDMVLSLDGEEYNIPCCQQCAEALEYEETV